MKTFPLLALLGVATSLVACSTPPDAESDEAEIGTLGSADFDKLKEGLKAVLPEGEYGGFTTKGIACTVVVEHTLTSFTTITQGANVTKIPSVREGFRVRGFNDAELTAEEKANYGAQYAFALTTAKDPTEGKIEANGDAYAYVKVDNYVDMNPFVADSRMKLWSKSFREAGKGEIRIANAEKAFGLDEKTFICQKLSFRSKLPPPPTTGSATVLSGTLGAAPFSAKGSAGFVATLPPNTPGRNTTASPVTGAFLTFSSEEGGIQTCGTYGEKGKSKQIAVTALVSGTAMRTGTFKLLGPTDAAGDGFFEATTRVLDAACSGGEFDATSGSLTVSKVSDVEIEGTVELKFPTGSVNGPFKIAICKKTVAGLDAMGKPSCR